MQTEQEYLARERAELFRQLRDVYAAPLPERREARKEWAYSLDKEAETIGERVSWLLAGNYGKGAYDYARECLARPRMNHVAILSQLVAALEWHCPGAFARVAWSRLSKAQKQAVDGAIGKAIESMED